MNILRLCEWSSVHATSEFWTDARRAAVQESAQAWREAQRLNALPLRWGGVDGRTLQARQWVGVLEIDGGRIEIYPKTDKALLHKNVPTTDEAQSALCHLLRLLEAAQFGAWVETDSAALAVEELTFVDVWAYMLARHLWPQLRRGLPSAYLPREDELPTVRGRILFSRQIARFQERIDRTVCAWDEFSPDTALLRLLKCACRFLRPRVSNPVTLGLLGDCLFILDEVADVTPDEALRATQRLTWTRGTERFRPTFDLARRLLQGQGPQMRGGDADTWVFLVDMNRVFESFVRVALEDKFQTVVQEQQRVGYLFQSSPRLVQLPDYLWQHGGKAWIGDAKWKLPAGQIDEDEETPNPARLSPADVRQLTTYAELHHRKQAAGASRAELAVFYPDLQDGAAPTKRRTWNDTQLHLVPLNIIKWHSPGDALPKGF